MRTPPAKMPNEQSPPQDIDAEMAMLGAALMYGNGADIPWDLDELRAIAPPETMFNERHGIIYRAILSMYDERTPVDIVTLEPVLVADGNLETVGGIHYLILLAESVPSILNAPFYARQVRHRWQLRELIIITGNIKSAAFEPSADAMELIGTLARRIEAIDSVCQVDNEAIPESELLRTLPNPKTAGHLKVPFGLGRANAMLDGGLDVGSLTFIAGRPSTGKTSMGLTLCLHAARTTEGCSSLFVSVEMPAAQIGARLLSARSDIPMRSIRSGAIDDAEFIPARNRASLDAKADKNLFVLDRVSDIRMIAAHVRRLARREHVRLVVIDYLGLCTITGHYERNDLRIGAMSALLKRLAAEIGVAVVILQQLSRSVAKEGREPQMMDLRDSGALEQDADNIILLHRKGDPTQNLCNTLLIIDKQRQGRTGKVEAWYKQSTMMYLAKADDEQSKPAPRGRGTKDGEAPVEGDGLDFARA